MLTQLSSVKTRLAILETDLTYDAILTNAIVAVSRRFDLECSRTLARTENLLQEFEADSTEISLACYPLETITRFELKSSEQAGWVEQTSVDYLLRHSCFVSLSEPLGDPHDQARLTYTGGYVLPGSVPAAGQTLLPDEIEQAAIEQVAFWFQNRSTVGVLELWPAGGVFQKFAGSDLLPSVMAVLARYKRWQL